MRCALVGSATRPLSQPAATVRPFATGRPLAVVRNTIRPGFCSTTTASVPCAALRTGVDRALPDRHSFRQRDARLGDVDREGPAGAGRVPVKLVMVLEEADLPRGAIFDLVNVRTGVERDAGAADAHPRTPFAIRSVANCSYRLSRITDCTSKPTSTREPSAR